MWVGWHNTEAGDVFVVINLMQKEVEAWRWHIHMGCVKMGYKMNTRKSRSSPCVSLNCPKLGMVKKTTIFRHTHFLTYNRNSSRRHVCPFWALHLGYLGFFVVDPVGVRWVSPRLHCHLWSCWILSCGTADILRHVDGHVDGAIVGAVEVANSITFGE